MSLSLYIVRVSESPENEITPEEWLKCIADDDDLHGKESSGIPEGWIGATVSGPGEWESLIWSGSAISAEYPQTRMTSKMLGLAEHFSAVLKTEDGVILKRDENGRITCDEF